MTPSSADTSIHNKLSCKSAKGQLKMSSNINYNVIKLQRTIFFRRSTFKVLNYTEMCHTAAIEGFRPNVDS